jgi:SAM-dependent methyltransferase
MSSTWIDPYYSTGKFQAESDGFRDAEFKVSELKMLLDASRQFSSLFPLTRVVDVGCGSGHTTLLLQEMCSRIGYSDAIVEGYDVHPDIQGYQGSEKVKFIYGDFCTANVPLFDLAVLFDVIEHVPAPIEFLRQVAVRSRFVALHIPLDDSIFSWLRLIPLENLHHPGHLLVMDTATALNVVAIAGLRTLNFHYSPAFQAPTGSDTREQEFIKPLRSLLFRLNPYLLQKMLGGVSLMLLAASQTNKREGDSNHVIKDLGSE